MAELNGSLQLTPEKETNMSRTKRTRGPGGVAVAALLVVSLAGCDDLLSVENPASLLDEDLERPELLATLAATPEANISGTMSSLNSRSGLLSDELLHPSTQLENVDAMSGNRLAANSGVEGHWRGLAQSRWLADEVATKLSAAGSAAEDIARANFWGGTARFAMADHYNVIVYDESDSPRGPIQVITDGVARFEAAASAAAGADANLQAASLGQVARGYRSLYFEEMHLRGNTDAGLMAQAESKARAALAANGDYNVSLQYGAPGGSNGVASLGGPNGGINRIDGAVYNFLPDPVTGNWDPRIPHSWGNVAEDLESLGSDFGSAGTNLKFIDRSDPLPMSRAAEAMLIIAEARLLAGDLAEAVVWINKTRAAAITRVSASGYAGGSAKGWPPQTSVLSDLQDFASSDADDIYAQLKHERQAEFFLELRRWPDMRYYRIVPARWLAPNVAAGMDLRWPPAPEEVAQNPNLSLDQTRSVFGS